MLVSLTPDAKANMPITNMHVSSFEEMCLFTTHIPTTSPNTGNLTTIEVRYAKPHAFKDESKAVDAVPLSVPLLPHVQGLETVQIRMHHSPTLAHDMGSTYNDWFSARFGYQVKLLYLGANRRKILGNVAPAIAAGQARGELPIYEGLKNVAVGEEVPNGSGGGGGWFGGLGSVVQSAVSSVGALAGVNGGRSAAEGKGDDQDGVDEGIGFSDVAPFLIVSTRSWENAAARLPSDDPKLDVTKFRPNIVVEGADDAFEEDFWGELILGKDETRMVLTQNCARCNSLNVDYETGKVGEGQKGRVLALLNKDRRVDPGSKWSPIFGRYGFLCERSEVVVRVGDEVRVSKRNAERMRFGECFLTLNLCLFSIMGA
jgi:uncharacterized protein YcbX